jgi:hypothetical protein
MARHDSQLARGEPAKSADKLVCDKCHSLVSISALDSIVLPLEGDAVFVECDQAAIGDGDAVV